MRANITYRRHKRIQPELQKPMSIPRQCFDKVIAQDLDEHRTTCAYDYWENEFPVGTYLSPHLATIKDALGPDFTRSELVNFYRLPGVQEETKFIAAMIWGHEAPAGSRRDSRGPWKLSKMFADSTAAQAAIRSVSLATPEEIVRSYKVLDKALDRCGPNFFTKYFYFSGKAQGMNPYPLIFDDRVASGLVKISTGDESTLGMVRVSAIRKPEAYLQYLDFARREAERIGCEIDKIEYYLFNL